MGIISKRAFLVETNSWRWASLSSLTVKACVILRLAFSRLAANFVTWDFEESGAFDLSRSTLANANEARDWSIFADFAQVLIASARPLYAGDPIGVDMDV